MEKKFFGAMLFLVALIFAASFLSVEVPIKGSVKNGVIGQNDKKVKILIFAGHEPEYGGAEYQGVLERDLNLLLAEKIKNNLAQNPKFEIVMVRDGNGWNPEIKNYVAENKKEIEAWVKSKKAEMFRLIDEGKLIPVSAEMGHRTTPLDPAIFMYGVNKWAGDNGIDATLHVHFNNNPKYKGKPNYEGFAIYVPEKQYANAVSSLALAQDLAAEISKIQKVSTMKAESKGIIEDQELIALGCYNTGRSAIVLAEYAYIYEKLMANAGSRNIFIDQAASSTAQALENYFQY